MVRGVCSRATYIVAVKSAGEHITLTLLTLPQAGIDSTQCVIGSGLQTRLSNVARGGIRLWLIGIDSTLGGLGEAG